jgi:hypothetical protein
LDDPWKSIEISLFTHNSLRDKAIGIKIFSILNNSAQDYAPEKVDNGKRWKKLNPKQVSSFLKNWGQENNIVLKREKTYKSEMAILLGDAPSIRKGISCWVEEAFFSNEVNIHQFLDTAQLFYDLLHPYYGSIHSAEHKIEMATIQDPRYGKTVLPITLEKGLPGIYWANYFGPDYVERLGRDKLLSAPSYKIKQLSDGGLLLLTAPSPLVHANPEIYSRCQELMDYIGREFFWPNHSPSLKS